MMLCVCSGSRLYSIFSVELCVAGGCFLPCWGSNLFIEQVKAARRGLLSPRLMKTQIPLTPVNWLGGVKCLPTRPHRPLPHTISTHTHAHTHTHSESTHKVVSLQTAETWHFDPPAPVLQGHKHTHQFGHTHTHTHTLRYVYTQGTHTLLPGSTEAVGQPHLSGAGGCDI